MAECKHTGQMIGISDGSSIYAWKCSDCGQQFPRNAFVRGKWRVDSANERLKGGDANAASRIHANATSPGVTAGASGEGEELCKRLETSPPVDPVDMAKALRDWALLLAHPGAALMKDLTQAAFLIEFIMSERAEAATLIRRLVAERDEARKALATDARIDAIFAAILTTRDNPEDGTRDHLPRPLRNYLSEACGSAGLTGFNDGYAEAQGKFESRATAAEAEVERLRAENAELKAWKKRRQEEDEDEADRREIW